MPVVMASLQSSVAPVHEYTTQSRTTTTPQNTGVDEGTIAIYLGTGLTIALVIGGIVVYSLIRCCQNGRRRAMGANRVSSTSNYFMFADRTRCYFPD